ncbi:MAG: redoxin domain-containing protein [Anaerolineaceae bacterium]|nr:redoxin domain-containing protein [Anaerolineaceae bacterium]
MHLKQLTGATAVFLLITLVAAACTGTAVPEESIANSTAVSPTRGEPVVELPDLGAAPEFQNEVWLNSDSPVTLADQRGKVVLLEFWTFGCINCQRTIPWVKEWQAQYEGDDFTVISIHYPEFAYEREIDNVRDALARYEITYPVAIDNDRQTWRAYNQRYWPTTYLIDKNGRIRYHHIGEFTRGTDQEAVAAIEALMAEPDPVE